MKLFKLEMGNTLLFGAADSLEDMFDKRAEVDPTFHYLPVQIEEIKLDGYDITVIPVEKPPDEQEPQEPKRKRGRR